jgi:hypothetical protein
VLKREQGEIREPGDVVTGCIDPEHTAFVTGAVAMVERESHPRSAFAVQASNAI